MAKLHLDRLVAHRGWPERFPENSLPGLSAALAAGARWIEFDLQLSADAVPLLVHDTDLERIGDRSMGVLDHTAELLQQVPCGEPRRFGDTFADLRLTSLADAVSELAGNPAFHALVEVKPESVQAHGAAVVLDRVLANLEPLRGRFTLISDDADWLALATGHGPPVGWIVRSMDEATGQRAAALRPDLLIGSQRRMTDGLPQWPGPWRWVVYTVNEPRQASRWFDAGAWLVETDAIGRLLDDTA